MSVDEMTVDEMAIDEKNVGKMTCWHLKAISVKRL
jgi:hypothetical protein